MKHVALQPRVLPLIAALAALGALGWCAPSRAAASCGDYVTMAHDRVSSIPPPVSPGLTILPAPDGITTNPAPPARVTQNRGPLSRTCRQCPMRPSDPGGRPCRGPWCSGDPIPIPIAPPTVVESPGEPWALHGAVAAHKDVGPAPFASHAGQFARVHHVSSIYHPPRVA